MLRTLELAKTYYMHRKKSDSFERAPKLYKQSVISKKKCKKNRQNINALIYFKSLEISQN